MEGLTPTLVVIDELTAIVADEDCFRAERAEATLDLCAECPDPGLCAAERYCQLGGEPC